MQCPSCGATTNNSEVCIECGHSIDLSTSEDRPNEFQSNQPTRKSTLIEFPGVSRSSVPEWRKELSVRVREVQERRAREAAREAAEAERQRAEAASSAPQLELLPQSEAPAINPLVAAALKRIERANQSGPPEGFHHRVKTAAAIAYAPSLEVHEAVPDIDETPPSVATPLTLASPPTSEAESVATKTEKIHSLVVVPLIETAEIKVQKQAAPKRLIVDDPNDPALNYLDSISRTLRVDEVASNRASAFRRLMCGLFDLLTCALIVSPIGLALYSKGIVLTEVRPLTILVGAAVVFTFFYFTLSIAMTGRTWAMRMFSMRVIDIRTGLIPTGGQSAGRAFFYLISLAMVGLGILYALVSREGETMHDRLTRTAVVKI
ncbi:MAG TPA: RDD family protein [Pyrinomonadaceae bacterium]|nr:RDD family protein [Pyrinomonadaceae bacterium]